MNFDFSDEQEQFRTQVRRFLEKADGLGEARKLLEGGMEGYSAATWSGLAEMGVPAIAIPEEYGGLGLGALELCVVAEEIGRSLAPVPFLSSVGICSEAICMYGTDETKARWLPGLAEGSTIGTWAQAWDDRSGSGDRPCVVENGRLTGVKLPVLDGMLAHVAVVSAMDKTGRPLLALCDLDQAGVKRKALTSLDPTRPAARISFDDVPVELLSRDPEAWDRLRDRAAVLLAFEQLGAAETALAMAREYSLDRVAFGRKIGSFQAIKHKLTDMYVGIELARSHCFYGAWASSTGSPEISLAAAGARCSATDALDVAAKENIQIHGGIGVTWESNCQLFYRRARLDALILGSRLEWQNRLVNALGSKMSVTG
ncbi:acyl-CoA dehydrogenase family protein [Sphingobium sp. EM0848]|uniref:acyl-CoA dehydrogenase family protein n=1 Tax=Sphingobium sp. EM0848 TaxID=2743473 RepID=UPI00159C7DEC|nr:acyl-CoA dehydrogenase family protein [Sphingobium sp. EM0848]